MSEQGQEQDRENPPLPPGGGLPKPIIIAIGFIALDSLWVLLLLAKIGPRLWTVAWTDSALAFLPLSGFSAWFIVATSACVGLFRRSRRAWTAALALMAVSAALLSYLLYVAAHVRGMDFHTLVLVSALVCFLSPLLLLLAGRHADLAPAGG